MSNKKNGSQFEREFAKAISSKNNWVHIMADNANGQPFDVIKVEYGHASAYDCKVCKGDIFPFSRIEANQHLAFERFSAAGGSCYIAIKFGSEPNKAYCIDYNRRVKWLAKTSRDLSRKGAEEIAAFIIQLHCD